MASLSRKKLIWRCLFCSVCLLLISETTASSRRLTRYKVPRQGVNRYSKRYQVGRGRYAVSKVYSVPTRFYSPPTISKVRVVAPQHIQRYVPNTRKIIPSSSNKVYPRPGRPTSYKPRYYRVLSSYPYNKISSTRTTTRKIYSTPLTRRIPSYFPRPTLNGFQSRDVITTRTPVRRHNENQVSTTSTSFFDTKSTKSTNNYPESRLQTGEMPTKFTSTASVVDPTTHNLLDAYHNGSDKKFLERSNRPQSSPTKPAAVLRISTTSMIEARKLLEGIGSGFKITIKKTHPNHYKVFNTSAGDEFSAETNVAKSRRPITSARRDTATVAKSWWKGKHVCVSETPGLYGLPSKILMKIITERKCKETKYKYICTERFGFGGRRPKKKITRHCCSGYHINTARTSCIEDAFKRRSDLTDPMVTKISRNPGSPAAPSIEERITVFMPNDEALIEALSDQKESDVFNETDGRQVQEFLENHVIPNVTLLSDVIQNNQVFKAISGNNIRVNFFKSDWDDVMTVNCIKVSVRDVINENSVVYFIEKIIKPVTRNTWDSLNGLGGNFSRFIEALNETGFSNQLDSPNMTLTVFAPTNQAFDAIPQTYKHAGCLKLLVQNHLLTSLACSPAVEVHPKGFLTQLNKNLTFKFLDKVAHIDGKPLLEADVMTSNGVIHTISSALLPSKSGVLQILKNDPRLSDAMEMVQAADIPAFLHSTRSNFTIVAPTNKAFKKFGKSNIMRLLADRQKLLTLERFHVIPKKVTLNNLKTLKEVETYADGCNIFVGRYKRKIRVTQKGRRRIIGKTTFLLQCSRVLRKPTGNPCNGAVIVVDKILEPTRHSVYEKLSENKKDFSIALNALHKTRLHHVLKGKGFHTIFAPTNKAFKRLSPTVLRKLLTKIGQLRQVMKLHIVRAAHCSISLLQRSKRLRSIIGYSITSCPKGKKLLLGRRRRRLRAKVTIPDILAKNGILHGIDNILLPRRFSLQ